MSDSKVQVPDFTRRGPALIYLLTLADSGQRQQLGILSAQNLASFKDTLVNAGYAKKKPFNAGVTCLMLAARSGEVERDHCGQLRFE